MSKKKETPAEECAPVTPTRGEVMLPWGKAKDGRTLYAVQTLEMVRPARGKVPARWAVVAPAEQEPVTVPEEPAEE